MDARVRLPVTLSWPGELPGGEQSGVGDIALDRAVASERAGREIETADELDGRTIAHGDGAGGLL